MEMLIKPQLLNPVRMELTTKSGIIGGRAMGGTAPVVETVTLPTDVWIAGLVDVAPGLM